MLAASMAWENSVTALAKYKKQKLSLFLYSESQSRSDFPPTGFKM